MVAPMGVALALALAIILGAASSLGLRHANFLEEMFSGRDRSDEFLGPAGFPGRRDRQAATRAACLVGIIASIGMIVSTIWYLANGA